MSYKDILNMLICPISRQPLHPADAALIAKVNKAVGSGGLKDQLGRTISEPFDEALVREDGKMLYPVRDDIPVMLPDEAVDLAQLA